MCRITPNHSHSNPIRLICIESANHLSEKNPASRLGVKEPFNRVRTESYADFIGPSGDGAGSFVVRSGAVERTGGNILKVARQSRLGRDAPQRRLGMAAPDRLERAP